MQKRTEKQLAKGAYSWLRISPILTVGTFFFLLTAGIDEGIAVLGSALWHLLLLQFINNRKSDFVRWHGLQAALIAGIRTLIPIAFLIIDSISRSGGYFFCWTIPVLIIVWAVATPWGNKQVEVGECTLARWMGNNVIPPLDDSDPNQLIPQNINFPYKEILAELMSDDAVTRISALMRLGSAAQLNNEILRELKIIASDDENEDARIAARELLNKFTRQSAIPASHQTITTEIKMNEDKSQKPEVILKNILNGLQSDDPASRLSAVAQLHSIPYSSEAIRNELEKLALKDPKKDIRESALAALDLATNRNVRVRFNKIARNNRTILLQEIKDWENLGFLQKQTADVIRRRYDFDFTTPPAPKPVLSNVEGPAPVQKTAPVSVPTKASQPVQMTTSQPVPGKAAPALTPKAAAKPVAPPKPKQPPVDWKKVRGQFADAASSGALLRALLYLGAFMIVISATVLVVRFWNVFDPILQLIFIASVPLIFYVGGWILRTRLKLTQAGTVLTGIGAILVAVDFAAIYQLGGLASSVNGSVYWFVVSIFCTLLYAFTTWKIQGEFFDYLTLIAGTGMVFALTSLL
ncbi:MAG TPA: hypothetical protein VFI68_15270, partial [Anaerolineales bacterium]|nr:hypothetical protein [Anaerolineales bacterium]